MNTNQITLSPRLQAIADWVKPNSQCADIGTDHGYLPLYLLQSKKIHKAIAADLNQGPLDRAKALSTHYQIPLDLRLCNGLQNIHPTEVDTITIAGMGGLTIASILQQWQQPIPWQGTFLLQPMSTQQDLRLWLQENHYLIQKETTVCEGKTLYSILSVTHGKDTPYTLGELYVGKHHSEYPDPLRKELLKHWVDKTETALQKLPENQLQRQLELTQLKESISNLIAELEAKSS